MNDKLTISTFQLFQKYPDAESARMYFEKQRWPNGPVCPHCEEAKRITTRGGKRLGYFRCGGCREEFTVRTGAIFERSHVPLHKWLYAMYLVVTSRKGISSLQLSKEIGVTQKTAWFMLGRLREGCGQTAEMLKGVVEVDETFVGGKPTAKNTKGKTRKQGASSKHAVIGAKQRGGKVVAKPLDRVTAVTAQQFIVDNVEVGAAVHTDENRVYGGLLGVFFDHHAVNHSKQEYARWAATGMVTTNSIEAVWSVLKRSIEGTWHHVSPKHLGRYVNEAAFRLGEAHVKVHTLDRLAMFAHKAFTTRITYRQLVR